MDPACAGVTGSVGLRTVSFRSRSSRFRRCLSPKSTYDVGMDQECVADESRSPTEVAYRALALISVVGVALGADRVEILNWLKQHDLWQKLTPSEAEFLDTSDPSQEQIINASWLCERLIVIVWALGALEQLPLPNEQCDTASFLTILPPYAPISVSDFVTSAQLRHSSILIEMADEMLSLHWEARDAMLKGLNTSPSIDIGIIQERHHAINWLIGYDGLDWDEVTTDT